jgi:hypothetical protein
MQVILFNLDPLVGSIMAKLTELKIQLHPVFPSSSDDVLLCFFKCSLWPRDLISVKGQLSIGRNCLYFVGTRVEEAEESVVPKVVQISMKYRDITLLEIVSTKRLLAPDLIQVEGKGQKVCNFLIKVLIFSLFQP